ncbi:MAG: DotU family type IV/VI secretion system protein, partial [Pyrinomonadaceae bacterium]|nr:DotU family type IV/VI secretion system protein [Pyrinomonadaceae bacterium]
DAIRDTQRCLVGSEMCIRDRLATMQETANALVKVGKIKPVELSPHWLANDQPVPPKKRTMPVWAKIGAVSGLGLGVIVYFILFMLSYKFLSDAAAKLKL